MVLKDLPPAFRNTELKITQWYSTPDDPEIRKILSQDKYQTLPLTRGADRYEKDFTSQEVAQLNRISREATIVKPAKAVLNLAVDLDAYGIRLIEIEPVPDKRNTSSKQESSNNAVE